jgi:CHAT domain-containing protein/Tfp pilus assembly protein PilF
MRLGAQSGLGRFLWIWSFAMELPLYCLSILLTPTMLLSRPSIRRGSIGFLGVFQGIFALFCFSLQSSSPERSVLQRGIIVESVVENFEAKKAGVRPGDILLGWKYENRKGDFTSPFDLSYIRLEQGSRGTVELEGLRGNKKQIWTLRSDSWGIFSRPNFYGVLLEAYEEEQRLIHAEGYSKLTEHQSKMKLQVEESGIPWMEAWFLSHAALVSGFNGSWNNFDKTYQTAVQAAAGAGSLVRAELLREWASGFLARNDPGNAIPLFEQSLAEWQMLSQESMVQATTLEDLGETALRQGNLVTADKYFAQAATIAKELAPNSPRLTRALLFLGAESQDRGDMAKAEEYYLGALGIQRRTEPFNQDIALTLNNLGTLAHRRGDLIKARGYYRQSLAASERGHAAPLVLANVLSNAGECAMDLGNANVAEKYENRALQIRAKWAPDQLDMARSFRNLGKIARSRGNLAQADVYYSKAVAIGDKIAPRSPRIADFVVGLANVKRDSGDLVRAEEYYRRVLEIVESIGPGGLDHAERLGDLAGVLRLQKRLDDAGALYREAFIELENNAPMQSRIEEDRSWYRAIHARYYREYVDLLMAQGKPALAFQALEASRARTLFEMLVQSQVTVREGAGSDLLARERDARQLLNAKSQYRLRLLTSNHTNEQLARLDEEWTRLRENYEEIETEIRANDPGYAALTQPRELTLQEMQNLLDPETILLEYSLGEEGSHVWIMSDSSLTVRVLPRKAEIESQAHHLYDLMSSRNRVVPGETQEQTEQRWQKIDRLYLRTARDLSRMILGPAVGQLANKRLLIVSDGILQFVPFSALPSPEASLHSAPLIVDHEIINIPSMLVLAELRRQAKDGLRPAQEMAVFADPVFSATDERVLMEREPNDGRPRKALHLASMQKDPHGTDSLTRSLLDFRVNGDHKLLLGRLLYTRKEAEAVTAGVPSSKVMKALDFKASRATATSRGLGQYRIVHFATHALLNNEHPELSGLVLSLVNKRGQPQDGFLNLEDIYNLHLSVDLVVLSACDTALGQQINGEGLVGLTRGFLYAGASRVVASLWSVDDAATSDLMADFYTEMRSRRMAPAAALRAAQIRMWHRRQWTAPYYWAAFQIHGEWR